MVSNLLEDDLFLIPFIHQEVSHIGREQEGKKVSVIFNETTRLVEAKVIVLRFISEI